MLRRTLRSQVRELAARVADVEDQVRAESGERRALLNGLTAACEAAGMELPDSAGRPRRHLYLVSTVK